MVERNKDFTCKYITQYSRNLNPQPQCRKAWGLTSCTNEQREKEKGFQMLYNKLRTECWKMTNRHHWNQQGPVEIMQSENAFHTRHLSIMSNFII